MTRTKVLAFAATFIGLVTGLALFATPAQAGSARVDSVRVDSAQGGVRVQSALLAGHLKLVNNITEKCVDVSGVSTNPGALVHQWECEDDGENDNQLWAPIEVGDGFILLQAKHSGLCLNARANFNGAFVDQQSCNIFALNQRWQFGPADNFGNLVLTSGFTGKCLALQIFSHRNGIQFVIRDCATTSGQLFHPE